MARFFGHLLLIGCLLLVGFGLALPAPQGGVVKREADPHHHGKLWKLHHLKHHRGYHGGGGGAWLGGPSGSVAHSYSSSFSGPFGSYASSGSFASSRAGLG